MIRGRRFILFKKFLFRISIEILKHLFFYSAVNLSKPLVFLVCQFPLIYSQLQGKPIVGRLGDCQSYGWRRILVHRVEGNDIKVDKQITASRVDESRGEANMRGRI